MRALRAVDFAARYADLCERNRDLTCDVAATLEEKRRALQRVFPEPLTYFAKERFFRHQEAPHGVACMLNIAVSESRIEFITMFECPRIELSAGGPFGLLAKRSNPSLPRYYKIPYGDLRTLSLNAKKGRRLYEDVRDHVVALAS